MGNRYCCGSHLKLSHGCALTQAAIDHFPAVPSVARLKEALRCPTRITPATKRWGGVGRVDVLSASLVSRPACDFEER